MIASKDRSGWFGASDTSLIMGNWKTKTFANWWMQKLGMNNSHFSTVAMNAGTYYEHAILDVIGAPRKDHQIILPEYCLRVNLDGDAPGRIYEVKTYRVDKPFNVSKAYKQQVNVQIYAKIYEEHTAPQAEIIAYGLTEEDYRNFFNTVYPERIQRYPIEYDVDFILNHYLPRLEYLRDCLKKGEFPRDDFDVH